MVLFKQVVHTSFLQLLTMMLTTPFHSQLITYTHSVIHPLHSTFNTGTTSVVYLTLFNVLGAWYFPGGECSNSATLQRVPCFGEAIQQYTQAVEEVSAAFICNFNKEFLATTVSPGWLLQDLLLWASAHYCR